MKNNNYYAILGGLVVLVGLAESIIAILQWRGVLESNHSQFEVTGTFANPGLLGGCLAVCLIVTVGLYMIRSRTKYIWLISALFISVALLLTDSRSGWLAAAIGVLLLLGDKFHLPKKLKLIIPLVALAVLFALYIYKKDSADGRLLIWRCTLDMIIDRPILGYGANGWIANYMYYQARYFEQHPDSGYANVADNAAYPYNDFLLIWAEYGIIGLLVVMRLIYFGLMYKSDNKNVKVFKAMLAGGVVFACFSYPLSALQSNFPHQMDIVAQNSFKNDSAKDAIRVLSETTKIIPTCELFCDLGDSYRKLNLPGDAERCYRLASNMIPSRITPKYKLFVLYKEDVKDRLSTIKIANTIMAMRIKVESTRALRMKGLVRQYLSR